MVGHLFLKFIITFCPTLYMCTSKVVATTSKAMSATQHQQPPPPSNISLFLYLNRGSLSLSNSPPPLSLSLSDTASQGIIPGEYYTVPRRRRKKKLARGEMLSQQHGVYTHELSLYPLNYFIIATPTQLYREPYEYKNGVHNWDKKISLALDISALCPRGY